MTDDEWPRRPGRYPGRRLYRVEAVVWRADEGRVVTEVITFDAATSLGPLKAVALASKAISQRAWMAQEAGREPEDLWDIRVTDIGDAEAGIGMDTLMDRFED